MAEFVGGEEKIVNIGDPVDIISKSKVYVVTADFCRYLHISGAVIGLIGVFTAKDKADEAVRTAAKELLYFDNMVSCRTTEVDDNKIEEFIGKGYITVSEANANETYVFNQQTKDDIENYGPDYYPYPDICLSVV